MSFLLNAVVFQPPKPVAMECRKARPVTKMVSLTGKYVPAYHLRCGDVEEKKTILYSHGNACDMDQCFEYIRLLSEKLQVNVLHYEYFGYGLLSQETPSEQGVYECADTAYYYLTQVCKIPEHKIILYGTSLGSGPTLYLASKHKNVKAVVLEAPFTSVVRTKTEFFMAKWWDMFLNYSRIEHVEGHLLIFHGEEDVVVPVEHGKELYKMCKKKYASHWIPNAGHNNIREKFGYKQFLTTLQDFIVKIVA